jgi:hypothetical protein
MGPAAKSRPGPHGAQLRTLYDDLGIAQADVTGGSLEVRSPIDGIAIP